MKTQNIKVWGLLAMLGLLVFTAHGDNPIIAPSCENVYGPWSCIQQGAVKTVGTLNQTNFGICVNETNALPVFTTNPTFTNGLKQSYVTHTCPRYTEGYETAAVVYTAGNLRFIPSNTNWPSLSGPFGTTGTYTYTAKFDGIASGGVCSNIVGITVATITVYVGNDCSPPVITQQPTNQTVDAGTNVTFTVTAGGAPLLSYQWYFNSMALTNKTNAVLSLNNVQISNIGNYSVIVANNFGSATSSNALLTFNGYLPPSITTQPANVTTNVGRSVTFSVETIGTALSYQWRKNGFNLTDGGKVSGANTNALTLTNVMPWDGGIYTVTISNDLGKVVSSYAVLRVMASSSIVAWGRDNYGQTDVPANLTNVAAIDAGYSHSLVLKDDGTVIAWGYNASGQTNVPADLTNAVAIAAGAYHNLALKGDGTVVGWGYNSYGEINVPTGLTNVVAIAAGGFHSLGLKSDGTVVAWGDNWAGETTVPSNLTNVVAIAAGGYHSLALKGDGTVVAWGRNADGGECNVPADLTNVVAIAADGAHNLALKGNGKVVSWGYSGDGSTTIPASLSNVVAITAGWSHSMALESNGRVMAWGDNTYGQTNVSAYLTNALAIAAGGFHNLALFGDMAPVITAQPTNTTVAYGQWIMFSVQAMGTSPLQYQWRWNGTDIPGATNTTLILTYVQLTDAGNYSVVVTNALGSTISLNALLTVLETELGRLGYWRFNNTNTWVGEAGQIPLLAANVIGIPSWSSNAVLVDNSGPAVLAYRGVETNGSANIGLCNGTIRFWFSPDWSSGTGPGTVGRLIELGNQTMGNGWWTLILNTNGTQLAFVTQTNGLTMTNLTADLNWVSNQWHQITLTYSPTNSSLYLDGQAVVTNGSGVVLYPNAAERADGFRIGCDANGANQARGAFDELETFYYPKTAAQIFDDIYNNAAPDGDGNGLPDWWEMKYFGHIGVDPNADPDGDGITILGDLQVGMDPNIISFSLMVTNQYVNALGAPVQVNVTGGVPFYFAVVLDSTNFTGATWNAYTSSNITVNLGSVQGWHDVWLGLRGLPPNATQTWQWKHLNLALPPLLVITNPVTNVVSQPIIQIYGYCQESLASISYDISNAVSVLTNQPSEITDQYYDTNACGFTTNYFECLDVPLTNGLNTITIHATDLAGNATTTNFNFTLDYSGKTNPPVVQITWPQDGTQISGSNFTCRGWIDDPTATVTTQLVFTNGDTNVFLGGIYTNVYAASVERNGNFWLENLPINAGTNVFTITVTDVMGNTSVTNISVIKSALAFTINPVTPDSQLWQMSVNLTGTISDSTYAVWVNGVKGHNNGNGTWSANNVPINTGGTASFAATAYTPSEQQPDGSYGN